MIPHRLRPLIAVAALLASFAIAHVLYTLPNELSAPREPARSAQVAAPASRTDSSLQHGQAGCLVPTQHAVIPGPVERGGAEWQETAAAAQLEEDACGAVWGLWFNSWSVAIDGDPTRIGHVTLPDDPPLRDIARGGVADFALPRGELWIVGRNGGTARHRGDRWEVLGTLRGCRDGDLQVFDGDVWIACGSDAALTVGAWNEAAHAWQPRAGIDLPAVRLAIADDGVMHAVGRNVLAAYHGGPETPWRRLAAIDVQPSAFAAAGGRLYIGTEAGMHVLDANGRALDIGLADVRITGIAPTADGTVWVSVADAGLHHHDGRGWHRWRYAQGLPDDEARDVLLDARGRLWHAGSRSGMLDERLAAAKIVTLAAPSAIAGDVFPDACTAARALLGTHAVSGEVAQQQVGGVPLVFFGGTQVCPDPWHAEDTAHLHHRRDDGAVLEVAYNGRRGSRSCGSACTVEQQAVIAPFWQATVHLPGSGRPLVRTLPLPEPLPAQSPYGAMLLARDDDVWIGTRDGGLYQYDGERWRHHQWPEQFDAQNVLQALAEDADGRIWAGSHPTWLREQSRHAGAPLYRWTRGVWTALTTEQLGAGSTLALQRRANGDIAVGMNGALSLPAGDDAVQTTHVSGSVLRDRTFIAALAEDRAGGWWLGHGSFDPGVTWLHGGRALHATTREGLFDDRIRMIAIDERDRVWLLAEDGRVAVYARDVLVAAMVGDA